MRNPLFMLVERMDNRKDEEKKTRVKKKIKSIRSIVIIIVIIIAAIIYVPTEVGEYILAKKKFESEQQQKEVVQREKEEKGRLQMEIDMGSIVKCGNEEYQVIYISNTNANVKIKRGMLVVDCRIRGQSKDKSINCYLDGAIYNEKVEYMEEVDKAMVLLRIDYQHFSEMIKVCLEEQGINAAGEMVFQPYLFIYCKFVCGKENLEGYYKVNIEEYGFGAVEEVDAPENVFNVYEIKI